MRWSGSINDEGKKLRFVNLIATFERDIPGREYPYLGQINANGYALSLLREYPCYKLSQYSPISIFNNKPDARADYTWKPEVDPYKKNGWKFGGLPPPGSWFSPDEGCKTLRFLRASLETETGHAVEGIKEPLTLEIDDLLRVLETAAASDVWIRLYAQDYLAPPELLERWWTEEYAGICQNLREWGVIE